MTGRIRWEDNEARWDDGGSILGRVGTLDGWLFQIAQASDDPDDETLALMLQLPGADHRASEITQGDNPESLKAEAERWLERFVSSLGAVFPGTYAGWSENEGGTAVQVQPQCAPAPPHPEETER